MERLSIFDIFKIGVGPSSSHTLGPWSAGNRFASILQEETIKNKISVIDKLEVHLYGSLSKTGKGHGTDIAVQLGLEGYDPKTINTRKISEYIEKIKSRSELIVNGKRCSFMPNEHIVFHNKTLPKHPNTLIFKACHGERVILEKCFLSLGGGFIWQEGSKQTSIKPISFPYPIDKSKDLIRYVQEKKLSIWEIVLENEKILREVGEIKLSIAEIFDTMLQSAFKGCFTDGILPGGLNVKRRAAVINRELLGIRYENSANSIEQWIMEIKNGSKDFNTINNWISCFALSVNEENASFGRIVTAPTNGSAGVIPAVLLYYYCFCDFKGQEDIEKFFLTAGEIGSLFKKGATISAALGGCQAEIGVSSAMAAGGLTEIMGGSPKQVMTAAEIAMEHHLGLTCDPIKGLVQIPCIERNSMGAMKAITAANLSLTKSTGGETIIDLDTIIQTMWATALDMNTKYKETSEGGLAINFPINLPEC